MRSFLIFTVLACVGSAHAGDQIFIDGFEPQIQAPQSGIGINLDEVKEYSLEYHFVNAFKQSRNWMTSVAGGGFNDTNQAHCIDLDADGYPQTLVPLAGEPGCAGWNSVQTTMFEQVSEHPAGEYLVLYDGQGSIEYRGSASLIEASPGRDRIQVTPSPGNLLLLRITATTPGNHIRNIRVLMPGFDESNEASARFHPDFLRMLEGFRAVRFMDWQEINGEFFVPNAQQDFADRPLVSDARWTSDRGVPIEIMVELANATGTEPWFNIPHRASDDYITQFAQTVLADLDPQLDLYVEYSNEVWNGGFPQGGEIEADANTLMPGLGDSGFTRRMNLHGLRTANVCRIWKQVFGAQADRVTCVLGSQAAIYFTASEALSCPLAIQAGLTTTPCHQDIDAVAIAPYFGDYIGFESFDPGSDNGNIVRQYSLDDLFEEILTGRNELSDFGFGTVNGGSLNLAEQRIGNFRQFLAEDFPGMRLVGYEGGQHLVEVDRGDGEDVVLTNLFGSANRDARMGAMYTDYLERWSQPLPDQGGFTPVRAEVLMLFNSTFRYGRAGNWGLLERIDQVPNTPKYNAVRDFNQSTPCWWPGCSD